MATAIKPAATEPTVPFSWPSAETIDASIRKARHAIADTQFALEDFAADSTLRIRRHPLAAVGISAAAGVGFGMIIGFTVGWLTKTRA